VAAVGQSGIQQCLVGKGKSVFIEKMLEYDHVTTNIVAVIPKSSMKVSEIPIILIREISVHNYR
jgi:hypothetical protein